MSFWDMFVEDETSMADRFNPKERKFDFYVYTHTSKETGNVFYVGKGLGNRAYTRKSRSDAWNLAAKAGFYVDFVRRDMSEDEALKLEEEEIKKHEGTCVNIRRKRRKR